MLPLPAGHEAVRERQPLTLRSPPSEKYVISNSALSFIYTYFFDFPVANLDMLADFSLQPYLLFSFFLCSLSIRKIYLSPIPYCLTSLSSRYIPFLFFFFFFLCMCFLCYMPLVVSSSYMLLCSSLFFFLLYSRMSPSLSLYTTP